MAKKRSQGKRLASSTTPKLEFVQRFEPKSQADLPPDGTGKIRITNGVMNTKSRSIVPIDPKDILNDIVNYTKWPVSVAGELVVKSAQSELQVKKTSVEFFAWLYEHFDVDWQKTPAICKAEFFEYCRNNAAQYVEATHFPHFPPVDHVLYCHPSPIPQQGQALDGLINFFNPATNNDRELIKAFILTLFWGGPPGSRPAFLITSNDDSSNQGRGYGKTMLLELCAKLCGGFFKMSQIEKMDSITKRIVNKADKKPRERIIAIDNLKTRRFSWADFESMITSTQISGHALFRGNQSLTALYTYVVTVNGACLAKDFSKRFVIIKLIKPAYSHTWQKEVFQYIEENQWKIIGDIGERLLMEADPLPTEGMTRFGVWELGVLCKVNDAVEVRTLILNRQSEFDDDDANHVEFGQLLFEELKNNHYEQEDIPGVRIIAHNVMHEYYQSITGEKVGKNAFKARIERIGLQSLKCLYQNGKERFWVFQMNREPLTDEQIEQAKYIKYSTPTPNQADEVEI